MQRSADAAPAHGATDPAAAPASRLRAKRARRRSAAPSACAAHAPTQPQRDAAAKPLECLPCARTLDRVAHALLGRSPPGQRAGEPGEANQLRLGKDKEPPDQRRAENF